jgi:hypothetical protein
MTQAAVLASNASLMTTPSGTAPSYICRAWVNFNGTGTVAIRASGNVSSITDNGTGIYTINFTTAMPDANYAPACISSACYNGASQCLTDTGGNDFSINMTTSACTVNIRGNGSVFSSYDVGYVAFSVFR